MSFALPVLPELPFQRFDIVLDARTYGIELRWNERAEAWLLSIYSADGQVLLAGRRVVVGLPLTARFLTPGLPKGELIAVDTTGARQDPGVDELGARVQLFYVPRAELPAEFLQ